MLLPLISHPNPTQELHPVATWLVRCWLPRSNKKLLLAVDFPLLEWWLYYLQKAHILPPTFFGFYLGFSIINLPPHFYVFLVAWETCSVGRGNRREGLLAEEHGSFWFCSPTAAVGRQWGRSSVASGAVWKWIILSREMCQNFKLLLPLLASSSFSLTSLIVLCSSLEK